jgi:hypothetical protein
MLPALSAWRGAIRGRASGCGKREESFFFFEVNEGLKHPIESSDCLLRIR